MASADFIKDPSAVLDYHFDWSAYLASGETLTNSQFIVSAGITVNSTSFTVTNTTVWLSGGTPGLPYSITNRITTSAGRTDDRTMTVRCQDR